MQGDGAALFVGAGGEGGQRLAELAVQAGVQKADAAGVVEGHGFEAGVGQDREDLNCGGLVAVCLGAVLDADDLARDGAAAVRGDGDAGAAQLVQEFGAAGGLGDVNGVRLERARNGVVGAVGDGLDLAGVVQKHH